MAVTSQARLFDTIVVAKIRLFVWIIFLGTAYTFLLRRNRDRSGTRMKKKGLRDVFRQGMDATHRGAVAIRERAATEPEVDRSRRSTWPGLDVRLLGRGRPFGFRLQAAETLAPGGAFGIGTLSGPSSPAATS